MASFKEYRVQQGDTPQRIALAMYRDAALWPRIVDANQLEAPYFVPEDVNFQREIPASGTVTFTRKTGVPGSFDIPAGTIVATPVDPFGIQRRYTTDTTVTLTSGASSVNAGVTCLDAGTFGNVAADMITVLPIPLVKTYPETVAPSMTFAGKTAGQTSDVPHVARRAYWTASPPAPGAGTEEPQSGYNALSVQDGSNDGNAGTTSSGSFSSYIYSFDLLNDLKNRGLIPKSWTATELKAALKSITVTWVGYGVGSNGGVSTNGATLGAWKASVSAWTRNWSNSTSAASSLSFAPLPITDYIDANGFVHLLAHATYPSNGTIASTIYTDFIKVDVVINAFTATIIDMVTNPDDLTNGRIWAVKLVGETIVIPIDDAVTIMQNEDDYLILLGGRDLFLQDDGELGANLLANADIATCAGLANIAQALQNRLATAKGEIPQHPTYGSNLDSYVGKNLPFITKLIELEIINTLQADPRVASAQVTALTQTGTVLEVEALVTLVGRDEPDALRFSI